MVGMTGFEPAASWSQTKRSTKLSHIPILMVGVKGIEPLASALSAPRSNLLSYTPILAPQEGLEPPTLRVEAACSNSN